MALTWEGIIKMTKMNKGQLSDYLKDIPDNYEIFVSTPKVGEIDRCLISIPVNVFKDEKDCFVIIECN